MVAFPAMAETCYEERVTTGLQCNSSSSNSADFTSGCTFGPRSETVEVPCGRWVNVFSETRFREGNPAVTHESACAVHGLKPASHQGKTCASGRRRPTSGSGWQYINYRYGVKGAGNGGLGGDRVVDGHGDYQYDHWDHGDPPKWVEGHATYCHDFGTHIAEDSHQDSLIAVFCK